MRDINNSFIISFRAAREYWADSIKEYFNVDASADMNDLARILLQDGRGNKQSKISGVFYRQFLPATNVC